MYRNNKSEKMYAMNRIYVVLALYGSTGMAQNLSTNGNEINLKTTDSSYVDVFPLAIGNQWIYKYDYEYRNDGGVISTFSDTGTVSLEVFDKVATIDSTRWILQATENRWTNTNNIGWQEIPAQIDTIEITEINHGHHQLYCDTSDIRSVLPFLPNLTDTALVYRYALVDTAGIFTFLSRVNNAPTIFFFKFKKNVGLYSVSMSDGCTCIPYYWTSHSLRNSSITDVKLTSNDFSPPNYHLDQNYPNPFNPSTTISFVLPSRSFVSLTIFNTIGKEVATLVSDQLEAGSHYRQWDASRLASGIYFYRLRADQFTETKKLVFIK